MPIWMCFFFFFKKNKIKKHPTLLDSHDVEKYSVQILGTTDSQVVQQSYTIPMTHNQK